MISAKKDKVEDIIKNINDICNLISEYWYSLYLYCFAVYLEPVVAQNNNVEYLATLKNDMEEKCKLYRTDYKIWKEKLKEYIENAKAFGDNQIYAWIKTGMKGAGVFVPSIWLARPLVDILLDIADNADKKKKEEKKNIAFDLLEKERIGENMEAIEEIENRLSLFDTLYNGKVELIKDHDDIYIRLLE